MSAVVQLTEYQQRWAEDKSRFKIANKARQTGFSFAVALEVVFDCFEHVTKWVLLSAGERQSKELMEKVHQHARAINAACEYLESDFTVDDKSYKMLELKLPNGSRIIGLPANPDTARGFSANVVLDEFAFHRDSREIWKALYPTITRGFKIRVVSTPNGKIGKYYDLIHEKGGKWSQHTVDIYMAKAQGLDIDIEDLRAGCGSEDDWLQEFCCQFIDDASSLLTYELIGSCEDDGALIDLPHNFDPKGDLWLGFDIGRRRDLSLIWLNEQLGDVHWTRCVYTMEKTKFKVQREKLFEFLAMPKLRRACIDETGIGMQLAEEAVDAFSSKVEPVYFTGAAKQEMAIVQLRRFEDRLIRIPRDRVIREDLHKVEKITTAAGNVRYSAERDESGHADRFWGLALAQHASDSIYIGKPEYKSVSQRKATFGKGAY